MQGIPLEERKALGALLDTRTQEAVDLLKPELIVRSTCRKRKAKER